MVDGGNAGRTRDRRHSPDERVSGDCAGRRGRYDVCAEGQLRVDARLLIVGGDEDAETDTEGEQQPEHEQAAIECGAAPARAGEQEPGGCRRPASCDPCRCPGDESAAEAHEQQGGADPEQSRGEEHVDRQRQGGVRVRVDDGGESRARGQPVDEPGDSEAKQVEVEPLPEWFAGAADAAAAFADAAAEGRHPGADARGRRACDGEGDADAEGGQYACCPDPAAGCSEPDGGKREAGAQRAGEEAEGEALERGERDEVAAACAAGA